MENNDDVFRGYGIEVELAEKDDFLKVKETLTRIGVASKKENTLYQSCHIFHKKGRYAVMHFKEMFAFDGKNALITDNDVGRRNTITKLLEDWKLVKILDNLEDDKVPLVPINQLKIISHKEKDKWNLSSKYTMGKV